MQFFRVDHGDGSAADYSPDVIFIEPVGSCTDISATVLGPLKEEFNHYRVAPFTVLVDPARAAALFGENADHDLAFLFEKQLQEADVVCISKSDVYSDAPGIPAVELHHLSAITCEGVAEWLDEILGGTLEPGRTILDIDYKRYAEAEAALAWLNLSFILEPTFPIAPAQVVGPFLDGLEQALSASGIQILHLKIFCSSAAGWLKAAICANGEEVKIEGQLDASPANRHELLLNLRAKGNPDDVRQIVAGQLLLLDGNENETRLTSVSARGSAKSRAPSCKKHRPVSVLLSKSALAVLERSLSKLRRVDSSSFIARFQFSDARRDA